MAGMRPITLVLALGMTLGFQGTARAADPAPPKPSKRPNIVHIVADDLVSRVRSS